jgi:ArpU family phage transcriptional regulator
MYAMYDDEVIKQSEIDILRMRIKVKNTLNKYKAQKEIANEDIEYITTQRGMSLVSGGNSNPKKLEDAMIKKLDADKYCLDVEKCLNRLTLKQRIILVNNYTCDISDIEISEWKEVDLPYPTSYYREKNKAIKRFFNFLLINNVFL